MLRGVYHFNEQFEVDTCNDPQPYIFYTRDRSSTDFVSTLVIRIFFLNKCRRGGYINNVLNIIRRISQHTIDDVYVTKKKKPQYLFYTSPSLHPLLTVCVSSGRRLALTIPYSPHSSTTRWINPSLETRNRSRRKTNTDGFEWPKNKGGFMSRRTTGRKTDYMRRHQEMNLLKMIKSQKYHLQVKSPCERDWWRFDPIREDSTWKI